MHPWIVKGREILYLDPARETIDETDSDVMWNTILWCVLAVCASLFLTVVFSQWL